MVAVCPLIRSCSKASCNHNGIAVARTKEKKDDLGRFFGDVTTCPTLVSRRAIVDGEGTFPRGKSSATVDW